MKIRTFTAKSLSAAMRQVKKDLGEDALIIATETLRDGRIEIRAAVEQPHTDEALLPHTDPLTPVIRPGGVADVLRSAGLSESRVAQWTPERGGFPAWADLLDQTVRFSPLPHHAARLMLVGPSGVGKTLLAAKLAAHAKLSGYTPVLITTDPERMGERARMDGYAQAIGVSALAVGAVEALTPLPDAGLDLVIIDAPALDPYDAGACDGLRQMIEAARAEPILVCPPSGDRTEIATLITAAKSLGTHRAVISKCDTVRRMGPVIEALMHAQVSLAAFSQSAYLGQGLLRAEGAALARLILRAHERGQDMAPDLTPLTDEPAPLELSLDQRLPMRPLSPDPDFDLFGDAA